MKDSAALTERELTQSLSYAGFILLSYELVKALIVSPIKAFYANTSFGEGMPFTSYESDVKSRHKSEFQACLLYLRDFMEAIDSEDVLTIDAFREHRNKMAHELPNSLTIRPQEYVPLLERVDKALFKLSNAQCVYGDRCGSGGACTWHRLGHRVRSRVRAVPGNRGERSSNGYRGIKVCITKASSRRWTSPGTVDTPGL